MEIEEFRDIPVTDNPDKRQIRKEEIQELFRQQPFIDGYHMQFGVHKGYTLGIMAREIPDVTWYGFDSFQGLPYDWDLGSKVCKWNKWHLDQPPKVEDNVILVEGWYAETVPAFAEAMTGSAVFIDIDCDVYQSAHTVLFGLNDRIVPGTVIRFDELCDWRTLKGWVKDKGRIGQYTK